MTKFSQDQTSNLIEMEAEQLAIELAKTYRQLNSYRSVTMTVLSTILEYVIPPLQLASDLNKDAVVEGYLATVRTWLASIGSITSSLAMAIEDDRVDEFVEEELAKPVEDED